MLRPKVLVAGCGTGRHPIGLAKALPGAVVLAVDLSRASLAYGMREARMRGVRNVAFAQADILKLGGIDAEFDLIESSGVLHHMSDPEAGLKSLLKALKPGGYLRLGLYSRIARHAVTEARKIYAEGGYGSDLTDVRAFRNDLIARDDAVLGNLASFPDFHTASEFRDLVMHVQEHQYDLKEVEALLKRNGLKFLGFTNETTLKALSAMPPRLARKRVRNLKAWAAYERGHPDTFRGMYQFFCQKI